jgi:hypothetical protein
MTATTHKQTSITKNIKFRAKFKSDPTRTAKAVFKAILQNPVTDCIKRRTNIQRDEKSKPVAVNRAENTVGRGREYSFRRLVRVAYKLLGI